MKNIILIITLLTSVSLSAQSDPDEIMALVETFFLSVVEKGDQAMFESISIPNTHSYSTRITAGEQEIRSAPTKAHQSKDSWKETMRKEGVRLMIEGDIAMAWVPYDFWINGEHSHCGIDIFSLLKVGGQWKMTSCTYTVEKNGCDEKIDID